MPSKSIVLDAIILIRAILGHEVRKRLGARDPEDWPILAAALALGCRIGTKETDIFGCGVATWTSANISIFLDQDPSLLPPLN